MQKVFFNIWQEDITAINMMIAIFLINIMMTIQLIVFYIGVYLENPSDVNISILVGLVSVIIYISIFLIGILLQAAEINSQQNKLKEYFQRLQTQIFYVKRNFVDYVQDEKKSIINQEEDIKEGIVYLRQQGPTKSKLIIKNVSKVLNQYIYDLESQDNANSVKLFYFRISYELIYNLIMALGPIAFTIYEFTKEENS